MLPFCQAVLKARRPLPRGYPAEPRTLGEAIRKRRLDLGLSQVAMARQLGVDPWTLLNWEKGRTQPRREGQDALWRAILTQRNAYGRGSSTLDRVGTRE